MKFTLYTSAAALVILTILSPPVDALTCCSDATCKTTKPCPAGIKHCIASFGESEEGGSIRRYCSDNPSSSNDFVCKMDSCNNWKDREAAAKSGAINGDKFIKDEQEAAVNSIEGESKVDSNVGPVGSKGSGSRCLQPSSMLFILILASIILVSPAIGGSFEGSRNENSFSKPRLSAGHL